MAEEQGLIPELTVTDCSTSVWFWCELLGFEVFHDRPEDGFAHLVLGTAHIMLDQADLGRTWRTGSFDPPLGRGINLQIVVPDIAVQLGTLHEAGWPLFMDPEEKWYRISSTEEVGVRQFLVQDPDGYLVRMQMSLGHRPGPSHH
ncbi:VOC family protein [Arachnia propionica]|uniref:Bleomycin resistance protein n=1 Tax=Arachnia propionica TaxID=1750 RepID=A0A3P1T3M9_9ACTN|nr:VOC family protein [Arachnia propionica]RRD03898.1 VOC family protein [Arachnia propionica]